jgi:protein-S-isoprenylcysteine O-methyltransferase Ste14
MRAFAYVVILVGIVVWSYPFVSANKGTSPAKIVDRRSRWGMLLQFAAFALIWQGHFWERSLRNWHLAMSVICFVLAALLSWSSTRALAGQLRIDAALGAEHRLVRSGPYTLMRNPIYTSMLLVLCAVGVIISGWELFLSSLALFIVGTEIRVRLEERLLTAHFGEEFESYRRAVPAYLPFLQLRKL